MSKRIFIGILFLLAIIAGIYFYSTSTSGKKVTANTKKTEITKPVKMIQTTLTITNNTKSITNKFEIKDNATVLELMELAKAQKKIEFTSKTSNLGTIIESINKIANDQDANIYWSLYVNDKMANSGAGTQKVTSNDIVQWKYQSF